ncbi:MetQ/NlpA family ABC transporter substrate-binding protein [Peptoniphilus equinus]|uniref:Lipoprotein n=1 Tax=Peptoniphilus equinus TaxID=3016343 RepID=A0ABY7QSY7_9FIRM|nr:MetQ/NlpA family ABC transporter substrate-binding protein [Peptoniphilus equinus]WBW49911.1 MetQ/NlpA family ABC transporter substrate-binding protein [Peptoniphilus equinus]
MKKLVVIFSLLLVLTACGAKNNAGGNGGAEGESSERTTVKVGLTGSESKVWSYIADEAAKEGIDVELVFFDSYPLPNAALASGEIDLNNFQHKSYLEKEVAQHGYDLTVLGETVIAPLGIYSNQLKDVSEIKDGDKIIIPDDVTNGGRALLLLEANGLIEVDDAAGYTPTLKDVTNPRNFDIVELAANNTPAALAEAPLVVINSGVAVDAGMIPTQTALVLEDAAVGDSPYINVIVARTEDKDKPELKRLVEIYHTDKVKAITEEETKGSSIPVW